LNARHPASRIAPNAADRDQNSTTIRADQTPPSSRPIARAARTSASRFHPCDGWPLRYPCVGMQQQGFPLNPSSPTFCLTECSYYRYSGHY